MADSETITPGQLLENSRGLISLTKFLKTMLWVSLGCSILSLSSDFMQLNLLNSAKFSQAQAESNDSRQQIVALIYLGAFIVTGVTFLKWIHQASSNCHRLGAEGLEYSPGWSVGYYFVPFLNLYKPFRAMKEIWQVSTNPTNWKNNETIPLLNGWWTLWLLSGFLGHMSFRLSMSANTISSLQMSTGVSMLSAVVDIPLYLVAMSLVTAISVKQHQLAQERTALGTTQS